MSFALSGSGLTCELCSDVVVCVKLHGNFATSSYSKCIEVYEFPSQILAHVYGKTRTDADFAGEGST